MRAIPKLFAASLVMVLGVVACATASARRDEAYPVWWSPELGLDNLDRIDSLLAKTIPKNMQFIAMKHDGFKKIYKDTLDDKNKPWLRDEYYFEPNIVAQHLVDSCDSLFKWLETGFSAEGYDAFQLQRSLSGYCYTLRALKTARPARTSHVRDFAFGDDAMDYIPVMVGTSWECRDINEKLEANRTGVSWSEYVYDASGNIPPYYKVRAENDNSLIVEHLFPESQDKVSSVTHITIYGRGDFNGDGIDDLLMGWDWKDMILSPHTSALYLVTRWKRDDVLRVVDVRGPGPWEGFKCVPRTKDFLPE